MAVCLVSFLDTDGMRHTVEIQADSMYEAAVLGVCAFRNHNCEPGEVTELSVEVRSSVVHTLTLGKVRQRLSGGARSPKEAITKDRLRALL